jgi:hypothetical protein
MDMNNVKMSTWVAYAWRKYSFRKCTLCSSVQYSTCTDLYHSIMLAWFRSHWQFLSLSGNDIALVVLCEELVLPAVILSKVQGCSRPCTKSGALCNMWHASLQLVTLAGRVVLVYAGAILASWLLRNYYCPQLSLYKPCTKCYQLLGFLDPLRWDW